MLRLTSTLAVVGLLILSLLGTNANAAVEYWTGSGTWGTLAWSTTSGGPYTSAWANYNDAVFEGASGTVTSSGVSYANSLTFNVDGYILSSGTITIGNPATPGMYVATGATATINSALATSGTGNTIVLGSSAQAGTLILAGNNAAFNNRALRLGGGTLQLNSNLSIGTNAFTIGASAGATNVCNLNLNTGSLTTGALAVQTNSATANTITIGSGMTLTTSGNVTIGVNSGTTSVTKLTVSGGSGAWVVSKTGGTFQMGAATGTNQDSTTVDLNGLGTFSADLGTTGTFRLGDQTSGSVGSTQTLTLAANSTIKAGLLGIGYNSSNAGLNAIKLGSGTQIINSNTINIGQTTNQRSFGSLTFNGTGGTIRVRAYDNSSAANLNMFTGNTGTGTALVNTFDVTGHSADLLFGTVDLMDVMGANVNTAYTSTFSFDYGTLGMSTLKIGTRTLASTGTATPVATVNIGSASNLVNSATLGTVTMAVMSGTAGGISGNLNITGTATTVNMTSLAIASDTASAAGGTATGTVSISGGATTVAGGITLTNRTTAGTVNGTLNLTGGTLTLGGDIIATGTGGTPTLNLNGGTLNMAGYSLGSSSNVISALNFQSGTLRNVAQINGGSTALTKSTAGTLILDTTNGYTGGTNLAAGTLLLGNDNALGTGTLTITGGATLASVGSAARNLANASSMSGSVYFGNASNTGALTLGGTATLTGGTTLYPVASSTLTVNGDIANGGNGLTIGGDHNTTVINGVLGVGASPTGGLTISTTGGTVILAGNNLFSGGVSLSLPNSVGESSGSALYLTNAGALGTGTKTVGDGGGNKIYLQNNITLPSGINFSVSGDALWNDWGNNTITGNITMQSGDGMTFIHSTSGTLTILGSMTANATGRGLNAYGAGNIVINGVIGNGSTVDLPLAYGSGGGNTREATTGTLTLGGANTYSGATTIYSGTLNLANQYAAQNSTVTMAGGNLTFDSSAAGNAFTFGGLAAASAGAGYNIALQNTAGAPIALTVGANNTSATYAAVLSGSGSLIKSGTGTQVLTGNNTYSGGTTIGAGALQVSVNNTALGTGTVTFAGGTLQAGDAGRNLTNAISLGSSSGTIDTQGYNLTLSGSITGGSTGSLAKSGTGTLTLAGGASVKTLTLNAGTIDLGNTDLVLSNAGAIGLTGAGGTILSSGAGRIVLTSGSAGNYMDWNGTTTINSQIVESGGSYGIDFYSSGTITLTNTANSFTGSVDLFGTTVSTSQIGMAGAPSTLGMSSSLVFGVNTSGGKLLYTGTGETTDKLIVLNGTGGATIDQSGTGLLNFANTGTVPVLTAGVRTLTLQGSTAGRGQFAGSIVDSSSGATSVSKMGTGTWILSGSSDYSGGTTISGGVLNVQNGSALGTGTVTITGANAGQLQLQGGVTVNNTISLSGTNTTLAAILNVSGTNSVAGLVNNPPGAGILFQSDAGLLNFTGTINTGAHTVTYAGNGDIAVSNAAAYYNLFKTGSGTLTLGGNNTFSASPVGNVFLQGGTLKINDANALAGSNSIVISSGATLDLNGFSQSIKNLNGPTGTPIIDNTSSNAVTLTINNTASGTFAGTIQQTGGGALGLTKLGNSNLTLSGSNSFTGPVLISGSGTLLTVSNASALGNTSGVTVSTSGTQQGYLGLGVSVSGIPLELNASTTGGTGARSGIIGTASGAWNGPITISGSNGAAQFSTNGYNLTLGGNITGTNDGINTMMFRGASGTGTINGTINTPNANFFKTDAGTWYINSTGNNWGATGVALGTLKLGIANALPAATIVTMGQGDGNNVTLDLNGFDQTVGGIQGASGATGGTKSITSTTGNPTLTVNVANGMSYDYRYYTTISGTLNLTKTGNGTQVFSTANSYVGSTLISAGTLKAGNAAAFGANGNTVAVNGGTLDIGAAIGNATGDYQIQVSGTGVGGYAIINSGTADQQNGLRRVTMTGDTTLGGNGGRFDIRALNASTTRGSLDMGGNTLTKDGSNTFCFVDTDITNPGNIVVNGGMLSFQTSSVLNGDSTHSVTVNNGVFDMWGATGAAPQWTMNVNNSIFQASYSTNNTWAGTVNLTGSSTIAAVGSAATVLTISGQVTGSGGLTLGGPGSVYLTYAGNDYAGGTTLSTGGQLVISTTDNLAAGPLTFAGGVLGLASGSTLTIADIEARTGSINWGSFNGGIDVMDATASITLSSMTATNFIKGNGAGTVVFGPSSTIGTLTVYSGTVDLHGNVNTINSLAGTGGVITDLAVTGLQTITLNQDGNSTFSGAIKDGAGTIAFHKSGTGTQTLGGANTFSGGVTVGDNSGTLIANVSNTLNALGTGVASVGTGSTLILNNTYTGGTVTISNTITGSGLLKLNFAAGTTARNTYMANVTGFTGTIELSNGGTTGDKWNASGINAPGATVQVDSGSQLFVSGTDTFAGVSIVGTGNNEGRGVIRLASALNAPITLAGNATIGNEGGSISGNISPTGVYTLTMGTGSSASSATLSGVLSDGSGILSVTNAAGTTTLSGSNTYSGATTSKGGAILAVDNVGLSPNSNLTLAGGTFGVINGLTFSRSLGTGAGQVQITGTSGGFGAYGTAGYVSLNGGADLAWGQTGFTPTVLILNGPTANNVLNFQNNLDLNNTGVTVSRTISSYGSSATARVNGVLSNSNGTANLVISGSLGTVLLTNNNTYTGNTTINTGSAVLALGATSGYAVQSSTIFINSGTTGQAFLRFVNNNQQFNPDTTTLAFTSGTASGQSAKMDLQGNTVTVGNWVLVNAASNNLSVIQNYDSLTTSNTGTLVVANATALMWNQYMRNGTGGKLALTKTNSGTLTLAGANITYTGQTTVGQGKLVLDGATAFNSIVYFPTNTTMDIAASSRVGGVSSDGAVGIVQAAAGAFTLLTINQSGTSTYSGVIQDTYNVDYNSQLALTKTGAGTQILTGSNSYTGGTTLAGGTLLIGNDNALGTGTITLGAGGLGTDGTPRSLNNAMIVSGLGTLGTATGNGGGLTLNGGLTVQASSTLNVLSDVSLPGGVFGGYALTKTGAGTLSLSNAGINQWNGGMTVNQGMVVFSNSAASGQHSAPNIVINNAGIGLGFSDVQGFLNGVTGAVNGAGSTNTTIAISAAAETENIDFSAVGLATGFLGAIGSVNYTGLHTPGTAGIYRLGGGGGNLYYNAGLITGSDTVVVGGTNGGLVQLTGNNTYSGGTTINGGSVLQLGSSGTTGQGPVGSGAVTVNGSGTMNMNGYNAIIGNLTGAGVVDNLAAGTTSTLTVAPTGSTALTINTALNNSAGTLNFILADSGPTSVTVSGASSLAGTMTFLRSAYVAGSALGNASMVYVENGGTITASTNNQTFARPFTVDNGTLRDYSNGTSVLTISGGITVNSGGLIFANKYATDSINITTNPITGVGGVALNQDYGNAASVKLSVGNNTYAGDTTLNFGNLTINAANALPNGPGKGNLVINSRTSSASVLNLNGYDLSINGLNGTYTAGDVAGNIINSASGTLTVLTLGNGDANGSYANVIADNAGTGGTLGLTKVGLGTQVLAGNNTYTGDTNISGGNLKVNGSLYGSGNVYVNSGGILSGTGSVGHVTVNNGGVLAVGNSVGTQHEASLILQAGSILETEFNTVPANDQIIVGNVNGLTLNGGAFKLYEEGTTSTFSTNGSYQLIQYSGTISGTGVSALAVDLSTKVATKAYRFTADGTWVNLDITDRTNAVLQLTNGTVSNMLAGGTIDLTAVVKNNSGWTGDDMAYTVTGDISGTGSVAADGSVNVTTGFTQGVYGSYNFSATASASNINIGGNATNSPSSFGMTVIVGNATAGSGVFDSANALYSKVASGTDYSTLMLSSSVTTVGALGSEAIITAGTAGADRLVSMNWRTRTADESDMNKNNHHAIMPADAYNLISDVVALAGTGGDSLTLKVFYDPGQLTAGYSEAYLAGANKYSQQWIYLAELVGGTWTKVTGSQTVDTVNHSVLATITHDGTYAVVPEPGTMALLLVGGVGVLLRRRRKA